MRQKDRKQNKWIAIMLKKEMYTKKSSINKNALKCQSRKCRCDNLN